MMLSEFKGWFEGFTEQLEGAPNDKQWARIKEKIDKIDGTPTTYPVFIDRWVRPYYWQSPLYVTSGGMSSSYQVNSNNNLLADASADTFDSHAAMHSLGAAEFRVS